jgi:hypothetical protein
MVAAIASNAAMEMVMLITGAKYRTRRALARIQQALPADRPFE